MVLLLGKKIKELRREKHITQEELGKKVGVSTSMIGMYETNARKPSYEVLLKISEYFNTTTDYLFGNIEEVEDVIKLELGNKIKNRRLELRLTLEEVSSKVKVDENIITRWELGHIDKMKRSNIALLAEVLKVSPLWVMGIEDRIDEPTLEEGDPSVAELKEQFEKLYPKIIDLSQDEKDKLLKMINIYLEE